MPLTTGGAEIQELVAELSEDLELSFHFCQPSLGDGMPCVESCSNLREIKVFGGSKEKRSVRGWNKMADESTTPVKHDRDGKLIIEQASGLPRETRSDLL